MRVLLVLLLILYAVKAHAADEVLFIDMNNSPREVDAAREAAKKSGRKLVVLPEIPDKERKKFLRLIEGVNAARKQYTKACSGNQIDKKFCEEKSKKYSETEEKKSKFAEPYKVTQEKLAAFLAANKHKTFSSVVISGHDGTGSFSGEFGRIADSTIAEELGKYPTMKDSIRSLHLWGCYTTSPGSLLLNWKKHFPNTSLITGYEGRAPLGDKPAGWHYLKGVLAKEPELLRAGDSAKLQKLLKKIPGAIQVTAGIYACDEYATLKDHYNIHDLQKRCDDVKPQIQEKGPEFECFLKAQDEKCADPPENVGSGVVRQFYELLHKASACAEITNDSVFSTYSRDTAIRLVFSREVQKNFGRIYGKQLGEIDDILTKMGAPERLRFKDIGNLTRREMLQRADELLAFLQKNKNDPFQDPAQFKLSERDAETASLKQFQQNLTGVMTQLHAGCVPFNWTEPDQKEKSECIEDEWLGQEGVKKYLDPDSRLRSQVLSQMASDLYNQSAEIEKVSGKNLDAPTQAKLEELATQAEKLRYYSNHDEGKLPPAYLRRIALREKYSKRLRELVEKGVAQPKSDLAAMKIMLEINQPEVEAAAKAYEEDMQRYETRLKEMPNASAEDRSYFENMIKSQRERMQHERMVLEATKVILSEAEWDSTTGKAQHLNGLKDTLGRRFHERDIESKSREVEMYRSYLKETGLSANDTEHYKKELKRVETELQEFKSETAAQIRLRGQDYLFKIRYKY